MVALTLKFIPEEVFERNRQKAKDLWSEGKPKKWYYAIPIVLLWIIIVCIILNIIL